MTVSGMLLADDRRETTVKGLFAGSNFTSFSGAMCCGYAAAFHAAHDAATAARGGISDEDALYEALRDKVIAGAVIDAYSREPLAASPLFSLDNVILSPHAGAFTTEALNAHTLVVTSTAPAPPFISGGSASYPPVDGLLDCLRRKTARVVAFDARREALEAGNPLGLNMVMLGALYGAADLPLTREIQMEVIRKKGRPAFAESNPACFERGFRAASGKERGGKSGGCRPCRGE